VRRTACCLALAGLVLLAGCGGSGGTDLESVTPAPTPEIEDEPTRTPAPSRLAPGLTETELVDPTALVQRHRTALEKRSHTLRERVVRRHANGTVRGRFASVVRRNGSEILYRSNWTNYRANGSETRRMERWWMGNRTYSVELGPNGTVSDGPRVTDKQQVPEIENYASSLREILLVLSIETNRTTERNGTTYYHIETPEPQNVSPLLDVTFVANVTSEGIITNYTLTYRKQELGRITDVSVTVSVEDIGNTTVERPAWSERTTVGNAAWPARADATT